MRCVLQGREPAAVWSHFEDICAIPHVSGDERALADHLAAFARERGLFCYRDEVNNVLIRLPASAGREGEPALMLQGHTDMVGERAAGSSHDFSRDGLALRVTCVEGEEWVSATDTTLGGDDGIAVAMMLAILDGPPVSHPTIECLFTVSEEVGLEGAWAFDPARAGVSATTMINLDSEAEAVVTAGCSGGVRTDLSIPVIYEAAGERVALTLSVGNLSGGHSGVEIHEGHTNAIKLLGRLIRRCEEVADVRLVTLSGGGKDNAIPREATATLSVSPTHTEAVIAAAREEMALWRREPNVIFADADAAIGIQAGEAPARHMTRESHAAVVAGIDLVRDGVLSMSAHVKGLVAYSRNLGILATEEGKVTLSMATRSASASHLDESARELEELARTLSAVDGQRVTASHRARYPGWDFAPVSPLRERWIETWYALHGKRLGLEVIHAGLECGILSDHIAAATGNCPDIISVGPDMRDIHTPRERLSIPSTRRLYQTLCSVIEGGK